MNYEFGPSLKLDYTPKDLPISITGTTRFYLAELSIENNFATGISHYLTSVGVSLNYYPVVFSIEPYVGLGIFYNFNTLQRDGTASPSYNGLIRLPGTIKNNVSAEITGGIKFSANTPINFIVEVTQTFNKPSYNLEVTKTGVIYTTYPTQNENFNFNSLFVKVGMLFKI